MGEVPGEERTAKLFLGLRAVGRSRIECFTTMRDRRINVLYLTNSIRYQGLSDRRSDGSDRFQESRLKGTSTGSRTPSPQRFKSGSLFEGTERTKVIAFGNDLSQAPPVVVWRGVRFAHVGGSARPSGFFDLCLQFVPKLPFLLYTR